MTSPSHTPDCHEVMDRFDTYLDGDLDGATVALFDEHLASCPSCAAEHAIANRMTAAFRELALERCPEEVLQNAVSASRDSDRNPVRRTGPPFNLPVHVLRWRRYALAAVIVLMMGLGSLPFLLNRPHAQYSDAEVAQARQEIELAFNLISDAGQHTADFLQQDVLTNGVVDPLRRSVNSAP